MAITVGLTGGIASGKSTVSAILREHNIPVIDADIIAREVVEPGKEAYNQIVKCFGRDILLEDGTLNRSALGEIVFNDEQKRQQLNVIVHPAVRKEMLSKRDHYLQHERNVILDIPLLFESNLTHLVDKVLLVYVDEEVQLKRLIERNGFSEREALARIKAQDPLKDKVAKSDGIINNNGSKEETRKKVTHIIESWNLK
ncbi:dephospho-CoA kinase [Priestia filamentosa]|uniref:Dephospho-CoA kinase n=1 Tax=Priestia filamentosa TaxID=1402861 RepID=A0A1X7CRT4_9BACI|nr:dephospho-CoA kinase [Priestia filamentosa]AKO94376.1 dephospho-CoA kinase [Priestia filamentosa]MDT3764662.1 dephospho-CoA kinase [Priestia filamentosa]OXS70892.1 dephospho-CoA kinase [Priestia filamentosa]RJS66525.1 dephospho-CoA kinase [Priestia filamentosa]WCM15266.1 dephospho-CoA kinase [Priestia filamentosa]